MSPMKMTESTAQWFQRKSRVLGQHLGEAPHPDLGASASADGWMEISQGEKEKPNLIHSLGMGTYLSQTKKGGKKDLGEITRQPGVSVTETMEVIQYTMLIS